MQHVDESHFSGLSETTGNSCEAPTWPYGVLTGTLPTAEVQWATWCQQNGLAIPSSLPEAMHTMPRSEASGTASPARESGPQKQGPTRKSKRQTLVIETEQTTQTSETAETASPACKSETPKQGSRKSKHRNVSTLPRTPLSRWEARGVDASPFYTLPANERFASVEEPQGQCSITPRSLFEKPIEPPADLRENLTEPGRVSHVAWLVVDELQRLRKEEGPARFEERVQAYTECAPGLRSPKARPDAPGSRTRTAVLCPLSAAGLTCVRDVSN